MNDAAPTRVYTLSLHDALPIFRKREVGAHAGNGLELVECAAGMAQAATGHHRHGDKLERSEEHTSNSSHVEISYAVFCLKKKHTSTPQRSEHLVVSVLLPPARG